MHNDFDQGKSFLNLTHDCVLFELMILNADNDVDYDDHYNDCYDHADNDDHCYDDNYNDCCDNTDNDGNYDDNADNDSFTFSPSLDIEERSMK